MQYCGSVVMAAPNGVMLCALELKLELRLTKFQIGCVLLVVKTGHNVSTLGYFDSGVSCIF